MFWKQAHSYIARLSVSIYFRFFGKVNDALSSSLIDTLNLWAVNCGKRTNNFNFVKFSGGMSQDPPSWIGSSAPYLMLVYASVSIHYINTCPVKYQVSFPAKTSYLHKSQFTVTWRGHRRNGYIINRVFFSGFYIINRISHARLWIWNLSSRVELDMSLDVSLKYNFDRRAL